MWGSCVVLPFMHSENVVKYYNQWMSCVNKSTYVSCYSGTRDTMWSMYYCSISFSLACCEYILHSISKWGKKWEEISTLSMSYRLSCSSYKHNLQICKRTLPSRRIAWLLVVIVCFLLAKYKPSFYITRVCYGLSRDTSYGRCYTIACSTALFDIDE